MAAELKVIGAGCGRTGTSSLREALKILGHNPYHMEECVRNDHFGLWLRAGRGDGLTSGVAGSRDATSVTTAPNDEPPKICATPNPTANNRPTATDLVAWKAMNKAVSRTAHRTASKNTSVDRAARVPKTEKAIVTQA